MTPATAFWTVFGSTVALLGVDLYTGLTGRRAIHLMSVALTIAGLIGSIVLAVRMGSGSDFDPGIQLVHRALARTVVVLVLPMAITGGIILWSNKLSARRIHRRVAFLLVGLALAATGTGIAMKRTARPEPVAQHQPPADQAAHRADEGPLGVLFRP